MGFFKQLAAGFNDAKAAREHAEAGQKYTPKPKPIVFYTVVYKGGLPEYPKEKAGGIDMEVFADRIELLPTFGTRDWFKGLIVPIGDIESLELAQRTLSTFEGILGGLDSRQLNQANNIHIAFITASGLPLTLRLEMLSGVTVMGQASKCQELVDRLRGHGLVQKFRPKSQSERGTSHSTTDIPDQIAKLAVLRDKNILTEAEFSQKKAELLSRM
jgi:hypothetical protein